MISGQDLLLGKRAVQVGLLRPSALSDALSRQQLSVHPRSLTEIVAEQELLEPDKLGRLRELHLGLQNQRAQADDQTARLAEYYDLLFGTTALTHGYVSEAALQRALEVLEQAEADSKITLGHVMVALNMINPEDIEAITTLQHVETAYCRQCDTIYSRLLQELAPGKACPRCGSISNEEVGLGRETKVGSSLASTSSTSDEVAVFSDDSFTAPGELVVRDVVMIDEEPPDALPSDDESLGFATEKTAGTDASASPREQEDSALTSTEVHAAAYLGEHELEEAVRAAGQSEYLRRITRRVISRPRPSNRKERKTPAKKDDNAATQQLPAVEGPFDHRRTTVLQPEPAQRKQQIGDPVEWRRPSGSPSASTLRVIEVDGQQGTPVEPHHVEEVRPATPSTEDSELGAGASIGVQLGEYVVLSELGRGGMGVVYLARKVEESTPRFAIKFIRKDLSRNATYMRRFEREVKLVLSLNHSNIVATHEYGQRDGYWFLVMEFVQGENLGDVLEREHRLGVNRAVSITRQTALALASAHEQGIVHRDMKPDNVILSPSPGAQAPRLPAEQAEIVKVTDFGLAKEMAGLDDTLTITGQLIGTPHYMSPEQCRGDYSDQRSDIYSLGCTFYHMLTGRPPFLGDNYLSVMEQQKNEPITPPHMINSSVPLSLSFIIGKMMEKNANDRYPTMELLISHLEMWDSNKLVDEVARYAPAFSRVRTAFGRSEEFGGTGTAGGGGNERYERELRSARGTVEWLRHKVARLERKLERSRSIQSMLVAGSILAALLGLLLGYLLGGAV